MQKAGRIIATLDSRSILDHTVLVDEQPLLLGFYISHPMLLVSIMNEVKQHKVQAKRTEKQVRNSFQVETLLAT